MLRELFRAMANPNGGFGKAAIPWFNGGLFDDDDVLPLGIAAIEDQGRGPARLEGDRPGDFGTLFESGLDDKKRAEMASLFDAPDPQDHTQGRLFTDPRGEPRCRHPLHRRSDDHEDHRAGRGGPIASRMGADQGGNPGDRRTASTGAHTGRANQAADQGTQPYGDFRTSLGNYRVLDPACGSGNFLALSLRALKDFDLAVTEDAAAMGLPLDHSRVGPEAVLGIEINSYAAELARLTGGSPNCNGSCARAWG